MAVMFNEPQYPRRAGAPLSVFSRTMIALGIARDARGAQRALLVLVVVLAAATAFMYWSGSTGAARDAGPDTTLSAHP